MRSFYQDRLGTNIRKPQKQTGCAYRKARSHRPEPLAVLVDCERARIEIQQQPCGNRISFRVLSLCLSRACLGKMIVLYLNCSKDMRFSHRCDRRPPSRPACSQINTPGLGRWVYGNPLWVLSERASQGAGSSQAMAEAALRLTSRPSRCACPIAAPVCFRQAMLSVKRT